MGIKILMVIAGLFVGFLIYAAQQPETFSVEATQVIKASPEQIFPHVNNLKAWNEWSPFEKGLQMKKTYSGPEEGAGAHLAFEGGSSGTGTSSIVSSSKPSEIKMNLTMTKPIACNNDILWTFTPQGADTKVTWAMSGKNSFIGKIMSVIFGNDMVQKQFQSGLNNLKAIVEKK